MPINEELTIRMDNRPGSLGKVCRALADRGVNILAFQSIPSEKTILVCMVVDNPSAATAILDKEGISYTEAEIAQAKLPHGPGALARAASKLGDANINIHYAYCGVEPNTNAPLVIFGVSEVGRAASILDQTAAAAAATEPAFVAPAFRSGLPRSGEFISPSSCHPEHSEGPASAPRPCSGVL